MHKKFLIAAATAATLALAGVSASASAATTDTTGGVDAAANVHITADFSAPLPATIYEGETLTFSVDFTNETGRQKIDVKATLVGEGCTGATISPALQDMDGLWTDNAGTLEATLEFTVTGLVPGECDVTVSIDEGGPNFDAGSIATATITVLPTGSTTTAAPTTAPATTAAGSQPANPVTGGNSTALAVMAFGFVLLGWATVAGTRRRHSL